MAKHWTQTPKGRERMRQLAVNRARTTSKSGAISNGTQLHQTIAYVYGRTEATIDLVTQGTDLSRSIVAEGVATLLRDRSSGQSLRAPE
jgi:hypothetical protein